MFSVTGELLHRKAGQLAFVDFALFIGQPVGLLFAIDQGTL